MIPAPRLVVMMNVCIFYAPCCLLSTAILVVPTPRYFDDCRNTEVCNCGCVYSELFANRKMCVHYDGRCIYELVYRQSRNLRICVVYVMVSAAFSATS